jgi:hypothetical protein
MTLEPFRGGIKKKTKNEWLKPGNVLALLSIIAFFIAFIVQVAMTINAEDRADKAGEETSRLQEQLNALLNSSLSQSNNLSQSILQLQNITSNFQTTVMPYVVKASIDDVDCYQNSSEIVSFGSLNISIAVITPHAAIINFSDDNPFTFTLENGLYHEPNDILTRSVEAQFFIDPSKTNLSSVAIDRQGNLPFNPYHRQMFIQPGVSLVNFSFPILADFYLNPLWLKMMLPFADKYGLPVYVDLGEISITVHLFDIQLQKEIRVESFSTRLIFWVSVKV